MKNKFRAIIFDLDDTVYDRNAAQVQMVKRIAERFPDTFNSLHLGSIIEAFIESDHLSVIDFEAGEPSGGLRDKRTKSFLRILGLKEDNAYAITEMYVREYPTINISTPGSVSVIKELRKSYPLAVITNGLPDVQYRKIEAIGLGGVFSSIILSEEIGIRKPAPEIFRYSANSLQVRPAECLFVGDSYRNDVVGAKRAGMRACWYNPGSISPDDNDVKADFTIARMEDLIWILQS